MYLERDEENKHAQHSKYPFLLITKIHAMEDTYAYFYLIGCLICVYVCMGICAHGCWSCKCGFWEANSSPLKEQQAFLATKPPLQSQKTQFFNLSIDLQVPLETEECIRNNAKKGSVNTDNWSLVLHYLVGRTWTHIM